MQSSPRSPNQSRKQLAITAARTVTCNTIEAPLDFSFYNMTTLQGEFPAFSAK